jgi:hypothetical protein
MATVVKPRAGNHADRVRTLLISAFDNEGRPAAGAEIVVFIHGTYVGAFTIDDESRSASLEIPDVSANVRLVAEFSGVTLTSDIGMTDHAHEFRFPVVAPLERALSPAEARCADGTTGRPCVTCTVGGTQVRICV